MSCKRCGGLEDCGHCDPAPMQAPVARAEYDAMVKQRDAFRRAYECLEAQVKGAYRELADVIALREDDVDTVAQLRVDLLAAWREAERIADESGRPPQRRQRAKL